MSEKKKKIVVVIDDEEDSKYQEIELKNIDIDFKPMKPVTCIYISGQK